MKYLITIIAITLALLSEASACGWTAACINQVPHVQCIGAREILSSWYAPDGRRTASGRSYGGMSAASLEYAFGTVLTVYNPRNGRTCRVEITDRGPFGAARSLGARLDMQNAAADCLGGRGTRYVCVTQ